MTEEAVGGCQVTAVRAFNELYRRTIKDLHQGLRDVPYSATEIRVIFELSSREATDVPDLRRTLGIDAGQLSRLLARLEIDGLASRRRSTTDARRHVIRLTCHGRKVSDWIDARSADRIRAWLAGYTEEERRRLVAALATIRAILDDTPQHDVQHGPAHRGRRRRGTARLDALIEIA
ncbi:MAG: MarR family transcriptional regulator [Streptosporangiales bacterium]|nr:MarR family transcriptional regulator [Streptosporangiales bacterium]